MMTRWVSIAIVVCCFSVADAQEKIRFATFNTSLNRPTANALVRDLSTPDNAQAKAIAAIIQRIRPDVLLLQEFDYDAKGKALTAFHDAYLGVGQWGQNPIRYPYRWAAPSNTGLPTAQDLDRNGKTDDPGDAQGFGRHRGQYAFALLSRLPFSPDEIRTFQTFRWTQMPDARLPERPNGAGPWYSPKVARMLRLSSKNHVIVPLKTKTRVIHVLAAHPTPPVFDGPEDRNGRRNADEIRLIADALSADGGGYLVDDAGRAGGIPEGAEFVVMGDLNADPSDGDSTAGAILQLLDHPRIHPAVARGEKVPRSKVGGIRTPKPGQKGNPSHHTAQWGLRVDYVLPSKGLKVMDSGVFWPNTGEPLSTVVSGPKGGKAPTDHRLVWLDLVP